jgi:hypothetical protein
MHPGFPGFAGRTRIASPAGRFLDGMDARVKAGLLSGTPHRRSRYQTTSRTQHELAFRAADVATAINVGLNDVVLRAISDHEVEYTVSYRRWAAYVIGLGALIGVVIIAAFMWWDVAVQIREYGLAANGWSSDAVGLAVFWGLVAFWTLVWPLILILAHKPFARKLLHRIIQEVDGAAQQAPQKTA